MEARLILRRLAELLCLVPLIVMARNTVIQFLKGTSRFTVEVIPEDSPNPFPEVTVCPLQIELLDYMKWNLTVEDLKNLTNNQYTYVKDNLETILPNLDSYLYTKEEIFRGCAHISPGNPWPTLCAYASLAPIITPVEEYTNLTARGFVAPPVYQIRETMFWKGRCFSITTNAAATNTINEGMVLMLKDMTFDIYLSPMNRPFPVFTATTRIRLNPNTETVVTTSKEETERISERGWLSYKKKYCLSHDVRPDWETRLLKNAANKDKITCQPLGMNVFNKLNLEKCTKQKDSINIWSKLLEGITDFQAACVDGDECLPDCLINDEKYIVEAVKNIPGKTHLKINGRNDRRLKVVESLEIPSNMLVVAIGGNLGLFIGLSVLDLFKFVIDKVKY